MSLPRLARPLSSLALLLLPLTAQAHVEVISSRPADSTAAKDVRSVTLTFSEPVAPALSGMEIVMTGMPGMEGHHPAMKINGARVAVTEDSKSLVATLVRPLPAGSYEVDWHAVGADAHRNLGKVSFTVP